jgi:hypothetical protein
MPKLRAFIDHVKARSNAGNARTPRVAKIAAGIRRK